MMELNKIYCGDCLEALKTFPDECVDCVVTSPPYWRLRDYGVAGQLGLEKTPEEYVAKMVEVFREVRRVLKKEGTLWLNLGDSYISNPGDRNKVGGIEGKASRDKKDTGICMSMNKHNLGLKPKDLCGIPWRVAFALQADGWWLRQDIIWAKPNPMPESVTDRCTKAHEYVFLMTKNQHYYFDADAIKEDAVRDWAGTGGSILNDTEWHKGAHGCDRKRYEPASDTNKRNRRSVWTIPTQSFSGAHFATFPERLIEPMIKAGTSEKGNCSKCGKAWERIIEMNGETTTEKAKRLGKDNKRGDGGSKVTQNLDYSGGHGNNIRETKTIGWQPTCKCNAETVPPVVMDIFMGAGTVGLVAKKLGVNYIGIELNKKYIEMAEKRIERIEENLFKGVNNAQENPNNYKGEVKCST